MTPHPQPRNQVLDLARLVAAYGVIVIHCAPETRWAGHLSDFFLNFCVPFFLITSLYFFWREVGETSDPTAALLRRLHRLLVPYAVWTVIYVAAHCAKLWSRGQPVGGFLNPGSLVAIVGSGGAAVQLYFLPLLAIALSLAWIVARLASAATAPGRRLLLVLLAAGLVASGTGTWASGAASPGARLLFRYLDWLVWMLPYVAASALVARIPGGPRRSRAAAGALLGLAVFVDLAIVSRRVPDEWRIETLLVAALVLLGCLRMGDGWRAGPRLAPVLKCSFGVYLVHHFLLELVEMADRRPVGTLTNPFGLGSLLLVSAGVFAASVAFALGVRRSPRLSRVLFGS
jgi:peptidoglycan/LPS O-acetylase OafA/YrhL